MSSRFKKLAGTNQEIILQELCKTGSWQSLDNGQMMDGGLVECEIIVMMTMIMLMVLVLNRCTWSHIYGKQDLMA